MSFKRVFQSILIIISILVLSLNVKERVYLPPISDGHVIFPPDPYETFSIGICISDSTFDGYSYANGFREALNTLGENNNYKFNYKIISSSSFTGIRFAISQLVSDGCDLIYPIGIEALSSALLFAPNTPIIMGGVIDFTGFTYTNLSGELTRNFTGVSSLPNSELLLSTMIEATDKIDGVGLLYSPEDTQSVYQMQRLEQMLNQAKIPWKEYSLDISDNTSSDEDSTDVTSETAEVADESAEDNAENLPEAKNIRIPRRSLNWTRNPKITPINPLNANNDTTSEDEDIDDSEEEVDDFSKTLNTAMEECSALFIPTNSLVCNRAEEISEKAVPKGITTITNDFNTGKKTLVSTYSNPYHQGYIAGEKAYEILANRKSVQEVSISEISLEKSQKLYSGHFANIAEKVFPKSFREVSTFNPFQK